MQQSEWTLPQALRKRARLSGERLFIQMVDGPRLSYAETLERAERVASGLLECGVRRGECVTIMSGNSLDAVCIWLGINMAGATEVWINPALRGASLEHALKTTSTRMCFADRNSADSIIQIEANIPALERLILLGGGPSQSPQRLSYTGLKEFVSTKALAEDAEPRFQDIASIVYTSGTTGPAKGVMMPHAQVYLEALTTVDAFDMREDDIFYCCHPFYHVAGKFMGAYSCILSGATFVLDTRFRPELWIDQIRRYNATVTISHGPMTEMIYAQPRRSDDASNPLRRMSSAPFPARIALDFESRFAVRVRELWGMTEVNNPCWQPKGEPVRLGSCGRVCDEWYEFRIADADTDRQLPNGELGELQVRPKLPFTMMQGYMNMPEATVRAWRNLWFHSGDLGYIDESGYVYFVDRVSERIRRRAENLSSYDIEAAANSHDAVAECAAIGVPSEFEDDDDVKICVVLKQGSVVEPVALLTHMLRELPASMVPRYIQFLPQLPRSPSTNKVQKALLRREHSAADVWDRRKAGVAVRDLLDSATSNSAIGSKNRQ